MVGTNSLFNGNRSMDLFDRVHFLFRASGNAVIKNVASEGEGFLFRNKFRRLQHKDQGILTSDRVLQGESGQFFVVSSFQRERRQRTNERSLQMIPIVVVVTQRQYSHACSRRRWCSNSFCLVVIRGLSAFISWSALEILIALSLFGWGDFTFAARTSRTAKTFRDSRQEINSIPSIM